jgi:hypothetical protein
MRIRTFLLAVGIIVAVTLLVMGGDIAIFGEDARTFSILRMFRGEDRLAMSQAKSRSSEAFDPSVAARVETRKSVGLEAGPSARSTSSTTYRPAFFVLRFGDDGKLSKESDDILKYAVREVAVGKGRQPIFEIHAEGPSEAARSRGESVKNRLIEHGASPSRVEVVVETGEATDEVGVFLLIRR